MVLKASLILKRVTQLNPSHISQCPILGVLSPTRAAVLERFKDTESLAFYFEPEIHPHGSLDNLRMETVAGVDRLFHLQYEV